MTTECPYTLQWAAHSPQNCAFPWGDLDSDLIHGSLGPPESSTQTASRAGTPYIFFRGLLSPNGILPGTKFTLRQVLRSPMLAALLHGIPLSFFLAYSQRRRLYVYHTSTHDVALRISNAGLKCAAWGLLKYRTQKFAICTPSHNIVGLYLRKKACIDNRKKIVK